MGNEALSCPCLREFTQMLCRGAPSSYAARQVLDATQVDFTVNKNENGIPRRACEAQANDEDAGDCVRMMERGVCHGQAAEESEKSPRGFAPGSGDAARRDAAGVESAD